MEEKTLKPRIRFKGFTEAWEQRKFDDVISRVATGLNPRDNFALNTGGKNYYVTIKNFEHGHLYLDDNCDKVDDSALAKIQARSDLQINDVLFTSIGRIGDCYLIEKQPKNWNINESVFTFRPNVKEVTPLYLFHVIHSDLVLSKILNDVTGSTFKSIKIGDLKKLDIPITSQPEQEILSKFISDLDSLITLHQRNENYNYKRGFEKSSRFSFSWEQRKVDEIANRYDNLRIPVAENLREKGNIPYYGANGIQDYVKGFTHEGEYVLIAEDGANDLENYPVQYVNGRIWVNNHAHVLQSKQNNSTLFLKYSINNSNISSVLVGGSRAKLNSDALMNFEIKIPNNEEQQEIANLFINIDDLITLHQRK